MNTVNAHTDTWLIIGVVSGVFLLAGVLQVMWLNARAMREHAAVMNGQKYLQEQTQQLQQLAQNSQNVLQLSLFPALQQLLQDVDAGFEKVHEQSTQQVSALREHASVMAREQRLELGQVLNQNQTLVGHELKAMRENHTNEAHTGREYLMTQLTQTTTQLVQQLQQLNENTERRLNHMRDNIEQRLSSIETNNARKLEEMRATVDEKLHATLEQRLGESFKQVSDRLEQVHRGLGEMQTLAVGVGDLKRVLTNVKTRGNWGEMQLASLLENVFTPDRYAANVKTVPNSNDMVEFAIKLPGRGNGVEDIVWLPIDAKFPKEQFERMQDAQDAADVVALDKARQELFRQIKQEAKTISEKYIAPPHTTDFGILFLPTEGLYAEVAREAGLLDQLQRDHRIVVAGPTTLTALLNSLHMGFRTLAMEQRASEVWKVLGAVKTEFGKFGDVLAKTKNKLESAAKEIDSAQVRTRAMSRALSGVEHIESNTAAHILGLAEGGQHVEPSSQTERVPSMGSLL